MILQEAAQILSSIGVIASLIYLAVQIRDNSRTARMAAFQQLASNTSNSWHALAHDGELTDIMMRGLKNFSSLSPVEKARFSFHGMAYLRHYENAWFQHQAGSLKGHDWHAIAKDIETLFTNPGARELWPLVSDRNHPNFRAFVDTVVARYASVAAPISPPEIKHTKRRASRK
jgi:hypothetical protein